MPHREIVRRALARTLTAAALAALAMSPASAIHAAAHPDRTQAILEHYRHAIADTATIAAPRTLHLKGRLRSGGMDGTFEEWLASPDRMLLRTTLGPIKTRTGFDGTVGWRTDLNSRRVTVLDGAELDAIASQAWFENDAWSLPDGAGGKFEPVDALSYVGNASFVGVEVTPPRGPARRLWFDSDTGLLDRVLNRRDQDEWTEWVREWRTIGGRRHWTVQTPFDPNRLESLASDSELMQEIPRVTIDSIRAGVAIGDSLFAPPASTGPGVAWNARPGSLTVPFRYGTKHVWIRASIDGGPPADFLLDTGCSLTAISRDYAETIGLKPEGSLALQGVSGSDRGAFARLRSLRVVDAKGRGPAVQDLKVALVNLGQGLEAVVWRKPAGLIGYDFLSHFVVTIDYDRERVTFHEPASFTPPDTTAPIPMGLYEGIPTVQVALDGGCAGEFILDVGNSFGLCVNGPLVRRCNLLDAVHGHKQVEVLTGGVGGGSVNWLARLNRVQIGPHSWNEPIAGLSLGTLGMSGSHEISGNLGNGVLERFRVTFDYGRRQLYLEPGRRFGERDGYSRSGTFLIRYEGHVYPGQIASRSPAYQAGLRILDEITAINGRPALKYTPEELDRVFTEGAAGSTHTLTVQRNGQTRTLTLVLADVL